jgi:hypothetical protein
VNRAWPPIESAPRRRCPPHHQNRGDRVQPRSAKDVLAAALLGVDLGAFDREIVEWLAAWDTPTVATVVSLLHRTRQAGRDERPPGTPSSDPYPGTSNPGGRSTDRE